MDFDTRPDDLSWVVESSAEYIIVFGTFLVDRTSSSPVLEKEISSGLLNYQPGPRPGVQSVARIILLYRTRRTTALSSVCVGSS
jgi:hypothetical protein